MGLNWSTFRRRSIFFPSHIPDCQCWLLSSLEKVILNHGYYFFHDRETWNPLSGSKGAKGFHGNRLAFLFRQHTVKSNTNPLFIQLILAHHIFITGFPNTAGLQSKSMSGLYDFRSTYLTLNQGQLYYFRLIKPFLIQQINTAGRITFVPLPLNLSKPISTFRQK